MASNHIMETYGVNIWPDFGHDTLTTFILYNPLRSTNGALMFASGPGIKVPLNVMIPTKIKIRYW